MLKTSLNKQKKRPLKTQNWIFRGRYRAVPPHLITFQQQLSTHRVRLWVSELLHFLKRALVASDLCPLRIRTTAKSAVLLTLDGARSLPATTTLYPSDTLAR